MYSMLKISLLEVNSLLALLISELPSPLIELLPLLISKYSNQNFLNNLSYSQVKVGETVRGDLKANQGNYIHVEIKVASGSPKPGFIGARLVNKNSDRPTTGTVPAKLDRDSNEYRTIIDLGDSVNFLIR